MGSLDHLQGHHGDFAAFRDAMVETTQGRFGPLYWGVWDHYLAASPPEVVVDLGTGPGLLLPMLRDRLPNARLIGVEVQPVMLETARAVAEEAAAELVEADLSEPVPLPDGVADLVNCVMVFHELAFPPPLLDECMRLLKPGGTLVFWDWVKWPLSTYLKDEALTPAKLQHFREHCLFGADDLEFLLQRAGFEVLERVDRRSGRFSLFMARKPLDEET